MIIARSLDLWGMIAVVSAAALLTMLDGPPAVRLPLSIVAVMFAPGYALVSALFPRAATFDVPERVAVSIGSSLALVSALALLLSFSPWGLTRDAAVLSIAATALPLAALALWRSQRIASADLPPALFGAELRSWAAQYPGQVRAVAVALAGIAAVLVALLVFNQPPAMTEFYALGPEGLARGFPRDAIVGQPVEVTIAITNRERRTVAYRIEVRDGEQVLAAADAGALPDGATKELPVSFTPTQPAEPRAFDVFLYADGQAAPYRSLRLLIPVRPASAVTAAGGGGR